MSTSFRKTRKKASQNKKITLEKASKNWKIRERAKLQMQSMNIFQSSLMNLTYQTKLHKRLLPEIFLQINFFIAPLIASDFVFAFILCYSSFAQPKKLQQARAQK